MIILVMHLQLRAFFVFEIPDTIVMTSLRNASQPRFCAELKRDRGSQLSIPVTKKNLISTVFNKENTFASNHHYQI